MTGNAKLAPIALNRAQLLGFDQTSGFAVECALAAKVGVKTLIHFGPMATLSLAPAIEPVDLDWSRLLGFDQAMKPGTGQGATASGILSPKIGPKEAVGFGDCVDRLGANAGSKVGFKDAIKPIID